MIFETHKAPRKNSKVLYTCAVFSALVLATSYYPLDLGFLAWFALTPFLLALRRSTIRNTIGLSFVFGYLYGATIFHWLPTVDGIEFPVYLLLLSPLFSLYYIIFGLLYRWAAQKAGALTLLLAPALWVTVEYARANFFFLSLPWNLLGHTQHAWLPAIQIADMTGVYGVSFVLVLVNEALSRLLDFAVLSRKKTSLVEQNRLSGIRINVLTPLAVMGLILTYGLFTRGESSAEGKIRIAIVQPGITVQDGMTIEERAHILGIYSDLTLAAEEKKPDLIVWPASSLPGSLSSRLVKVRIRELINRIDGHLLVGGSGAAKMSMTRSERKRYANTEFLLSRKGSTGQYHKVKLVPFNEYLPIEGKIRWPKWITTLEGNFTPGPALTLFSANEAVFGAPICWESLFPDFFRRFVNNGANLMVNPNNEAYMGKTAGPHQTMAMTVFRAVENRVAIARASSTGISAFIDPDGRVVEQIQDSEGEKLVVSGILVRDVPLANTQTFYTKHGDIFAYVMIALTLMFVLIGAFVFFRERHRGGSL
jgi:apolipoprotein N-acyltransferase